VHEGGSQKKEALVACGRAKKQKGAVPPKEAQRELAHKNLNSKLRSLLFVDQFKRVLPLVTVLLVFLLCFESNSLLLNCCVVGVFENIFSLMYMKEEEKQNSHFINFLSCC
jgi:hypothetical protein